MSSLRELTNAELDIVSGGALEIARPKPISPVNPIIVILEDILRIVEGCGGNNRTAAKKAS
jgi:hypothetical protein